MSEYSEYYERDGLKVTVKEASKCEVSDPICEYLNAQRHLELNLEDMSKTELRLLRQVVRSFNRYIGLCLDMKED